ncbi:uncharacterized protein LOC130802353 [Amaranthus tricolor]|uniref:uncharacterized protein LOC130802353 n=1 Tax=Amaranthus tricolor TaxID=29722 RepID=UPI002582B307|nr:uncharacterized protein LOC130802353 [Amaranthus tricolor]
MGSDAISNTGICSFNKNSIRKKKGNKQVKSKQNKVDVTREQNFLQANKERNVVKNEAGRTAPQPISNNRQGSHRSRGNQGAGERISMYSNDSVAWMDDSNVRKRSDRHGLTLSKDFYATSCSSSCSDEDRDDDGCVDDWEAIADALTAENDTHSSGSEHCGSKTDDSTMNCQYRRSRAWCPDDAYRPRSLPNLARGHISSWRNVISQQPSCPVCCEDFDLTDSSFLPCPCGFQICLFCHKKILEVDGRCPGCRKPYDSVNVGTPLGVQTARSYC